LIGERKFADAIAFLQTSVESTKNPELLELLAQAYTAVGKTRLAKMAKGQAQNIRTEAPQ
jgi:predicted Zn-dependent protease